MKTLSNMFAILKQNFIVCKGEKCCLNEKNLKRIAIVYLETVFLLLPWIIEKMRGFWTVLYVIYRYVCILNNVLNVSLINCSVQLEISENKLILLINFVRPYIWSIKFIIFRRFQGFKYWYFFSAVKLFCASL